MNHNEVTSTLVEWIKTLGYFVAVFTFDYLWIPEQQFAILWILMVIDTITGVCKAYSINQSTITSHLLTIGVLKKFLTLILVYVIAILGLGLGIPAEHFMEWGLSILIVAEWYSAIQNIYAVRTGKELPEYDVISILLKKLSEYLQERLDKVTIPIWKK